MSEEQLPERRDIQSVLSDIRVDVGQIKVRQEEQGNTLKLLTSKLDLGVFREEYERRHQEIEKQVKEAKAEAETVRDDYLRRQGAQRVWRWVYGFAIAALGGIEVWFHH